MAAATYAPTTGQRVHNAQAEFTAQDWAVLAAVDAALAKLGEAPVAKVAKKARVAEMPARRALMFLTVMQQAHAVGRGAYAPGR